MHGHKMAFFFEDEPQGTAYEDPALQGGQVYPVIRIHEESGKVEILPGYVLDEGSSN